MNLKNELIKRVSESIDSVMKCQNLSYEQAKWIVSSESVAGVAVWNVVDKKYAGSSVMKKLINLNFHSVESGYARVYFQSEKALYCLQQDFRNQPANLYACTKDGEPDHTVSLESESHVFCFPEFEKPSWLEFDNV